MYSCLVFLGNLRPLHNEASHILHLFNISPLKRNWNTKKYLKNDMRQNFFLQIFFVICASAFCQTDLKDKQREPWTGKINLIFKLMQNFFWQCSLTLSISIPYFFVHVYSISNIKFFLERPRSLVSGNLALACNKSWPCRTVVFSDLYGSPQAGRHV